MNDMVGRLDRNTQRPMTTHAKNIARRAELAASLSPQHDRIGSHRHILHRSIKGNYNMCRHFMRVIVQNPQAKLIWSHVVWSYVKCEGKIPVKGLNRRVERASGYGRL